MHGTWWLEKPIWTADMEQVIKNHLVFIEKQKGFDVINFRGISIQSYDGVYHPLPGSSTYVTSEGMMKYALPGMDVLEMGTGSGAIALTLAHIGCKVTGVDVDQLAIQCAKANARNLNLMDNVEFIISDMFSNVPEKLYDMILFNPPLLHCEPIAAKNGLAKRFDDIAIDPNGMLLLKFAEDAKKYLKVGGRLVAMISNIGHYDAVKSFTEVMETIGEPEALYAQYRASGLQWRFVLSVVKVK